MLIYLALILPIVAILVMFLFFRDRLHWGEAIGALLVPLILIFALKGLAVWSATRDTEWYGGYVTSAWYFEDWNEYIHKTCSYTTCSGSGKNQSCTTHYYDCSYVEYHPEYWSVITNRDENWNIRKNQFEELSARWNNKTFKDLGRHYYTNDGDAYYTVFNGDFSTLEPTTTEGSYENRVAVSKSIFNFRDIEPAGLYEYPKLQGYGQKCLLGYDDANLDFELQKVNGLLGNEKQVRIFFLVWKNQPIDKAFDQQQYWKNGNKNELVINVGTDDTNKVNWVFVFSWTPNEQLKVDIKDYLENKPLDIAGFLKWIPEQIREKWVRKEFKDFAYIAVEPSTGWVYGIWIITFLSTVGIFCFCVLNNLDCEQTYENNYYGSYRHRRSFGDYSGIGVDIWFRFLEYLQRRDKSAKPSGSKVSRKRRGIR